VKINFGKKAIVAGAVAASLLSVVLIANSVLATTTFNPASQLNISGSTTCFPIFKTVLGIPGAGGLGTGGTFQTNTGASWNADVEQGASGVGLSDCQAGANDVGLSSTLSSVLNTQIGPGKSAPNVTYKDFARDGVCILVNNQVTGLTGLTFDQIANIFGTVSGQTAITTWSALGATAPAGSNNITVIGREVGSGTRDTLDGVIAGSFSGWTDVSVTSRQTSSSALLSAVQAEPGGIAYEAYGYVSQNHSGVTIMNISNNITNPVPTSGLTYVAPTPQSITSAGYPLARTLKMETNTNGSTNSAHATQLMSYMENRLGQDDVATAGFVKLNPDEDVNADGHVNISDIASIGTVWLQTNLSNPGWIPQDVNQDGKINISDIALIGQWWLLSYTVIAH